MNTPHFAFSRLKAALVSALVGASASTFAATYYVVVPVPNRTVSTGDISVALTGYTLPAGVIGRAYPGFDFNSLLSVTGDPSYTGYGVRWSVVSGTLPSGLTLSAAGKLTGTPTASSNSSFQVMAAYKTKAGQQSYQVLVADVSVVLAGDSSMPAGVQGAQYSYDLKPRLTVSGDPQYTPSQVSWSVASGMLPSGLRLNSDGTITGVPDTEGTYPFSIKASYLTKSGQQSYQVVVGAITVGLSGATIPTMTAGTAMAYDLKPKLTIAGDAAYAGDGSGVSWSVSGSLPAGLALGTDGRITGTPTAVGTSSVTVTAGYKTKTSAPATYSMSVTANIKDNGGYRTWSDGTYAASCQGYLAPSAPYSYSGVTGDGVYRINLGGTPTDVYCNQTLNGGGWTLLMKQAKGDGSTLQGDTTYWTNGTTLNDTAAGRNVNDGNFVSAAFAKMAVTQFMLQAANESTVQLNSVSPAQTAQTAFSNAKTVTYGDGVGVPSTYPNWFVRTTTYPDGTAINQSRFGFNILELYPAGPWGCGVRWGWASNQDAQASPGSDDACGGLGGYGIQYGLSYMNNNKGAWQPATLYLWAK
ncbi:Ig domain-containing protein [Burkholderia ubonensis]|uniref:Ig domain-containing protein n=1 Tax=Burkholderia ubonensis TaxID=101571 RepID=UPI0009B47452|nr:Ig domain-containing protein [Burkholderia ubonensis]